jgi:hypothetical protein
MSVTQLKPNFMKNIVNFIAKTTLRIMLCFIFIGTPSAIMPSAFMLNVVAPLASVK